MTGATADTCTRVYSPNGAVAHLAPPGRVLAPLCPASAKPPRDGWRGTQGPGQRNRAASLPTCKHCERIAAARDTQTRPVAPMPHAGNGAQGDAAAARQGPEPREDPAGRAAPETPAGGEVPAGRAGGTGSPLAGSSLPDGEDPAARRAAQRGVWKRLLSAHKAGQLGDRGRRARASRGGEYRPGQNRSGGQP